MLFILAEKHKQEQAYAKALQGRISHPNRYIDEVDDSKTLPQYPKIQLSYLQGHAYELEEPEEYNPKLKDRSLKYLPIFPKKMKRKLSKSFIKYSGGRKHEQAINRAVKDNHAKLWYGSDPDLEGEGLITEYADINHIAKYATGRIWVMHGLTVPGLIKTFHHDILDPAKTRSRGTASHARETSDWLIGMNISRLVTAIARKYGYKSGSYNAGRVQTPTLALITARREQRATFKPTTTYRLAFLDKNGMNFLGSLPDANGKSSKAMFKTADEMRKVADTLTAAPLITSAKMQKREQSAPKLPATSDMQGYLVKHAHISAKQSASVLEDMYDKYNAQTYPRTECNLITTDDFDELKAKLPQYKALYEKIIGRKLPDKLFTNLKPRRKYVDFTGKKVQKQGHGAITPEPESKVMSFSKYQSLSKPDQIDFKYVLACTLAMFADDHAYQQFKVTAKSDKYTFSANEKSDLPNVADWKQLFPESGESKSAKSIPASDYVNGQPLIASPKYANQNGYYLKPETTTPPSPIKESNLVSKVMEQYNLGTSSTRASIIASLKNTKLIVASKKKDKSQNLVRGEFMPTDKGIIDLELLRHSHLLNLAKVSSWQNQMKQIVDKKVSYDDFISGIKKDIADDVAKMPKYDYQFTIKPKASKFKDIQKVSTDVQCPKCKKAKLTHLTMQMRDGDTYKKIGFYSCSGKKCRFSCSDNMGGLEITPDILTEIISGKFPLRKFHSDRTGNDYPAKLVYYRGKIKFKFPPRKVSYNKVFDFKCPKCKKGKIAFKSGKSKSTGKPYALYVCTNPKCKFHQFQTVSKVKLTPDMMRKACNGTLPQMQFTGRNGKPFSATLKYSRGKLKFDFN